MRYRYAHATPLRDVCLLFTEGTGIVRWRLTNLLLRFQVSERGKKLHVLVAQRTDSAQWTCVAKNSAGEARKQIQLVVHMAPVFNDTLTSMPVQSYVPGTKFILRCHVDGIPPPTVRLPIFLSASDAQIASSRAGPHRSFYRERLGNLLVLGGPRGGVIHNTDKHKPARTPNFSRVPPG